MKNYRSIDKDTTSLPGIFSRNILMAAGVIDYLEPINLPSGLKPSTKKSANSNSDNNSNLKVYPVPGDKYIIVDFSLTQLSSEASIGLIDKTGRLVKSIKINDKNNQILVPTVDLPNGEYILTLYDSKTIMSSKISIMHP